MAHVYFELYAKVIGVGVREFPPRKIFETQGPYGVFRGMPKAKVLEVKT